MSKVVNKIEDLQGEVWKPVVGYEGYYEVSNLGSVRSLPRWVDTANGGKQFRPGKVLKPQFNSEYYHVRLSVFNQAKTLLIHRLVAFAFLGVNPEKTCVNHKDGNKLNNKLSNLEWSTISENTAHAFKNGLAKPLVGRSHPHFGKPSAKRKKVIDISSGEVYESVDKAAQKVGVSRSHLSSMLTGFRKNWTSIRYAT